jgi:hypothetical protein
MAIDFGRAARGIATGYLTAKVADTAAQDELNRDFILQARNQYFNVDKPNFVADEKLRSANINLISTNLNPIVANYADYNDITLDKSATLKFIKDVENLSDDERFNLESTITQRKKERTQTFDDKHSHVLNNEMFKSGGSGQMNMMQMFFPKEGEDIAEVGVKQDAMPMAEKVTPLSEIIGTGGTYDVTNNRHAVLQSQFDTDFRRFFVNDINQPTISFAEGSAQYDLSNELLKGYDQAVKKGFKKGKYEYARLNYIDQELKREGITGYNTGFDTAVEATTSSIPEGSGEAGAMPGDGKKFDAETFGQRKEDAPQINLMSQRQMIEPTEDQRVDNPASIINEARESIASIMEYDDIKADIVLQRAGLNQFMTSTLDEKKQALIANARQLAKDEIKNIGLNPDNFEL